MAEAIKAKRLLDVQAQKSGLESTRKQSASFVADYQKLDDSKGDRGASNRGLWIQAPTHLKAYCEREELTFEQINPDHRMAKVADMSPLLDFLWPGGWNHLQGSDEQNAIHLKIINSLVGATPFETQITLCFGIGSAGFFKGRFFHLHFPQSPPYTKELG